MKVYIVHTVDAPSEETFKAYKSAASAVKYIARKFGKDAANEVRENGSYENDCGLSISLAVTTLRG